MAPHAQAGTHDRTEGRRGRRGAVAPGPEVGADPDVGRPGPGQGPPVAGRSGPFLQHTPVVAAAAAA